VDSSSAAIGDTPPYRPHLGDSRQYWRDIILGVNDGLVSMFLLVAGVVGGGLPSRDVLLTAIAGAVAGAISMASGEYLATKSQDEVFRGEMALEEEHFAYHRQREIEELEELLAELGLHGDVLAEATAQLAESDESMLKVMMALEFGALEKERRSPWMAMALSGLLFLVGASPSVVPFFFVTEARTGLVWAAILAGIGLFAVGWVKSMVTRTNPLLAGLENFGVAAGGAGVSYLIGSLYGRVA
jgi:vacuolar iron transporter family protein